MRFLDDLCRLVQSLSVVSVLDSVIDALKVLVDWKWKFNQLVHLLIFGLKVCSHSFYISIEYMPKNIAECDPEEVGLLVLQLPELHVFDGVNDLILEWLVHCYRIFVAYLSFFILNLGLVLVVRVIVWRHRGVYFWVGWVGPHHGQEGSVERRFHDNANVLVVSYSLWLQKNAYRIL